MADKVTKDDLKKYVALIINTVNGVAVFIPGDAGNELKKICAAATQITSQDWFYDLLYFLINTFQGRTATKEQFAEALSHFSDNFTEGEAPKVYTFKTTEE